MQLSVLHRKLGRDLWRMRAQAAAIALVVSLGVMLLVMMSGLLATLESTRDSYLEQYRFASIFAPVTRAPTSMIDRLADIDGVLAADGRISGMARIDLAGETLPIPARVLSLPGNDASRLNDIFLVSGRLPEAGRENEVVLLESFAVARGIGPGDSIDVTLEGQRERFEVTGLACAPEFIFSAAPGEFMPDDRRFAVIWMHEQAAAAAYDLDGAFNDALLLLARGQQEAGVIAEVNRLLSRYGGRDAYGRDQQMAARFIDEEIKSLRRVGAFLPPIFLAVAAFLLNMVVSRIVQAERREIGLMKAFGHSGRVVALHYLELVLLIALAGAVLGSAFGVLLGKAILPLYGEVYKLPWLDYKLEITPFAQGIVASVAAATLGAALTLRSGFRLTPATAMRPPAPPDFSRRQSRLSRIGAGIMARFDQPGRMIIRQLVRQPLRTLGSVIGIAAGFAINTAMLSIYGSLDRTMELSFSIVDRSDASVTFVRALSPDAANDIASLPGVIEVEGLRELPVVFRHGTRSRNGVLTGLPADAVLNHPVDDTGAPIALRDDGVILSRSLADILGLEAGEVLRVEVSEEHRPVLLLPVVAIAETQLGLPAWMELDALSARLGQEARVSKLALRVDSRQEDALFSQLAEMPMVAGTSRKADAMAAFRKVINQGAGLMRYIMSAIAFAMSFGIVYNAARVAFAERAHELASLRVLGFTRGEVTWVLFGEIAVLVLLALPVGIWFSFGLSHLNAIAFSNETYQITAGLDRGSVADAVLVVFAALAVSLLLVRRTLDGIHMVTALKARE